MNLTYYVTGWQRITVAIGDAAALLEVCRRRGIPYDGFITRPDGTLSVTVRRPLMKKLTTACRDAGVPFTVTGTGGLPSLFLAFLRRPGLCAGLLLGLVLVFVSGQYVWDIRVSGTEALCARDVKEDLAACGFSVGTSLRGFRADVIENRTLLYDRRLSWISINRKGTVAYVQVRESHYPDDPPAPTPANLVASRGGRIERIELLDGNLLVAAGQEVSEGQLLVSGLYDSERVGYRWTHAKARVYARTARTFFIEIPLTYEASVCRTAADASAEGYDREISLIFFGKEIKFSKKTGNEGVFCDTIESEKNYSLIDGIGFPLSLRTTWFLPVETVTVTRTPAEAEALAYLELSRRLAAIPGGVELLSETITPTLTDTSFRLEVEILCVEDIAREIPFEILPDGE